MPKPKLALTLAALTAALTAYNKTAEACMGMPRHDKEVMTIVEDGSGTLVEAAEDMKDKMVVAAKLTDRLLDPRGLGKDMATVLGAAKAAGDGARTHVDPPNDLPRSKHDGRKSFRGR